jgi:hypothetical protein
MARMMMIAATAPTCTSPTALRRRGPARTRRPMPAMAPHTTGGARMNDSSEKATIPETLPRMSNR